MAKTIFLEIFGDSPVLRVFDYLIMNDEWDHSMTDIAKHAGIGYSTLKLFWPKLEQQKMIINSRTVGRAKMYALNSKNPIIKKFKAFYWQTVKNEVHSRVKKQKKVRMPM